jgi:O-antigen ligase
MIKLQRLTRTDLIPAMYFCLGIISLFASRGIVILLAAACLGTPSFAKAYRDILRNLSTLAGAALVCLMAWSFASSIWAPDSWWALNEVSRAALVFLLGLVFVAAVSGLNERQRDVAQRSLCYGTLVFVVLLAIEYASHGAIARSLMGDKITPDMQYTNHASAIFSAIIWPIAVILTRRSGRRGIFALCVLGALFIVWLLPIKASLVALIFGSIAAGATYVLRTSAARLIATVIVVSMLVLPWMFVYPPFQQSIEAQRVTMATNLQERLVAWEFVSTKTMDAPIIGHGFRASRKISQEAGQTSVPEPGKSGLKEIHKLPLHPHNWVLQVWLELGAIGIGFAVLLVVGLFRVIGRYGDHPLFMAAAIGSLVTFFCIASLSFGFWQKWWLATGWIALGTMALVAPRSDEND